MKLMTLASMHKWEYVKPIFESKAIHLCQTVLPVRLWTKQVSIVNIYHMTKVPIIWKPTTMI